MSMRQQIPVATPFFSREDYSELLRISDDADTLLPDYDSYVIHFENEVKKATKAGVNVIKINVKVGEFAKWCHSQNRKIDSLARAAYASFVYAKSLNPGVVKE